MILATLVVMTLNQGVQINAPAERVDIVRTDQHPHNYHPILDWPQYSRLHPYTITIRAKNGEPIRTIGVEWAIVDENGVRHVDQYFYDMPKGSFVVKRGSTCEFWPGGRMSKDIKGNPLMHTPNAEMMDMIEKAKSVTVTLNYAEFEDGTAIGLDNWKEMIVNHRRKKGMR